MKRSFSVPVILATCGFLLFALALWRASLETPVTAPNRALARLEPAFGQVGFERDGRKETVLKRRTVQRLDIVHTAADSEAVLIFASGEEARLLENSVALLEYENGRPLVVLKAGDLWAEKIVDSPNSVLVSREGVRLSLAQDARERARAKDELASAPVVAPKKAAPARVVLDEDKAEIAAPLTLTPDSINETLRNQRNLFFKCYGQLLQRTPGVSGEASLAFTIERTGKVSTAEVSSSSLQDPQFKRCLSEAVKRVEFKSFAGESVQTLFPLRFE